MLHAIYAYAEFALLTE